MTIDKLKNEIKNFNLQLKSAAIDEENLIISFIALSKDNLHKRYDIFGEEYFLSVDTLAITFSATTFYLDHILSFDNAIGKIIDFKNVDGDIKVKVQFFSEIEESKKAFLKYKNHISTSVSVGFGNCELIEMPSIDDLPHYRISTGEIIELSAVFEGADKNAKISNWQAQTTQSKGDKMQENKIDLNEINEIISLGKITNTGKEALEAIEAGTSYKEFAKSLLLKQQDISFAQNKEINIQTKKSTNFSLANYAQSIANGRTIGDIEFKEGSKGLIIGSDYYKTFATTKRSDSSSSGFIQNNYIGDSFIEDVFSQSKILPLCDLLNGLSGNVTIPRENFDGAAYFTDEGAEPTEFNIKADALFLTPHSLKARTKISREMLKMAPFALEAYIFSRLKLAIRQKLEDSIFNGTGNSASPLKGIFATDGVHTVENFFTSITYDKFLAFEAALAAKDYDLGSAYFMTNAKGMTALKAATLNVNNPNFLLDAKAEFCGGYKYNMNNFIKDNYAVFGDFKNILLATWGELEIQAFRDANGDITFTGFYDVDMQLKRANAFAIAKS